ncbi:hypothetical protein ACEWY4_012637 [Coilia grayii]|uniref:Zinc transporter ZIP6 n=1 Tax=Coilia grayii TaxID=363190 RepID=A0ABD1K125_9TELE
MRVRRWPRSLWAVIGLLLMCVSAGTVEEGCGGGEVGVATDGRAARQAQERHLWALFEKYGDGNGSLTLQGLQLLLQRTIHTVTHSTHTQSTHTHTHSTHTHSHGKHRPSPGSKQEHHASPTHSKVDPPQSTAIGGAEGVDPPHSAAIGAVEGKKSPSDAHHNLYTKRGQGSTPPTTTVATAPGRSRRSASYGLAQDHTSSDQATTHTTHDGHAHHSHGNKSQECLSASSLLNHHGIESQVITISDFGFLCPALLSQIDSQSCLRHGHVDPSKATKTALGHEDAPKTTNIAAAWLGGFLSICIISALALVGVVLLPLINRTSFNFLLSFLVALAVGTLSGDAFLHLIPHAQGQHKHHHSANESMEDGGHGDEEDSLRSVWAGLTALGGVYIMFLIEHFLTLGKMYKDKKHKGQKKFDQNDETLESEKLPTIEENDGKALDGEAEPNGGGSNASGRVAHEEEEEEQEMLSTPLQDADQSSDCQDKCHSHFHDTVAPPARLHHHHHDYHHILHHHHSQNHHPHTHTHRHTHAYDRQHFQEAGVATLAWMVVMGDGLHNFSDGLAIGAAFTEGLSSGLSTSVAVFCHELPHELGDFAVLLKAGMSVKQAVLYNVLSAMMAFLGMATGILIGHYAEDVATWVFALTAGLFLYVALVDMVPEMLHNDVSEQGFSHYGYFLLQNAGILLGFGIMLTIAILEPRIQLNLDL